MVRGKSISPQAIDIDPQDSVLDALCDLLDGSPTGILGCIDRLRWGDRPTERRSIPRHGGTARQIHWRKLAEIHGQEPQPGYACRAGEDRKRRMRAGDSLLD
jgi:hypothetical protein